MYFIQKNVKLELILIHAIIHAKNSFVNEQNSYQDKHNCLECNNYYYPSPIIKSICYWEDQKKINWYFDENKLSFALCYEECQTCSGPSINECLSCKMGKYLYLGYCLNQCPSGYSHKIIDNNKQINFYYQCYSECYENCETCSGIGI